MTRVIGQMSKLVEDALTAKLASRVADNRPDPIPATASIHVAMPAWHSESRQFVKLW